MQTELPRALMAQDGRCADCQRPITPATSYFHRAVNVAVCADCERWWERELAAYATQVGTLA